LGSSFCPGATYLACIFIRQRGNQPSLRMASCRTLVHPERSLSPSLSRASECWWKLVWCHQDCHKPELDPVRRTLMAAAQAVGASLVCLKRAQRFEEWVSYRQRPPFALLTNRREVVGCLQASAEQPASNRPAFTIVACEEDSRQKHGSPVWVQQLGTAGGPVLTRQSPEDVGTILAELAEGLRAGLRESGLLPPKVSLAAARRARPWRAAKQQAKACTALTAMPCPAVPCSITEGDEDEHASIASASTESPGRQCSSTSSSGLDEWWPAWPHSVEEILGPICKTCGSREELEHLLFEAMPDHYVD